MSPTINRVISMEAFVEVTEEDRPWFFRFISMEMGFRRAINSDPIRSPWHTKGSVYVDIHSQPGCCRVIKRRDDLPGHALTVKAADIHEYRKYKEQKRVGSTDKVKKSEQVKKDGGTAGGKEHRGSSPAKPVRLVRCVAEGLWEGLLTVGRIYEVLGSMHKCFLVTGNDDKELAVDKKLFRELGEERVAGENDAASGDEGLLRCDTCRKIYEHDLKDLYRPELGWLSAGVYPNKFPRSIRCSECLRTIGVAGLWDDTKVDKTPEPLKFEDDIPEFCYIVTPHAVKEKKPVRYIKERSGTTGEITMFVEFNYGGKHILKNMYRTPEDAIRVFLEGRVK